MIRSCFHCESHFDTINSSLKKDIKNPLQYCSKDCETAEEEQLASDIQQSKDAGLITADGLPQIATPAQKQGDLNKFIDSLRIKEK